MALFKTRYLDQIRFATVHHSAVLGVPPDLVALKKRLASHDAYHKLKGYPTTQGEFGYVYLLYAFAVAGNGEWIQTQDLKYQIYHATDWYKGAESANQWGFGILLEGNFNGEKPTSAQQESAAQIIHKINKELGKKLVIKGHKEYAAPSYKTECPGNFMGVSSDPTSRISKIANRVSQLDAGDPISQEPDSVVVIALAGLNVRTEPQVADYNKVAVLAYGDIVKTTHVRTGDWLQIIYLNKYLWVHSAYVRAL